MTGISFESITRRHWRQITAGSQNLREYECSMHTSRTSEPLNNNYRSPPRSNRKRGPLLNVTLVIGLKEENHTNKTKTYKIKMCGPKYYKRLCMKYFTEELCSKFNSTDPEKITQVEVEWKQNIAAYYQVFEGIKERIPKKFLKVYNRNQQFHDYEFVTFKVFQPKRWAPDPIKIQIIIATGHDAWIITYKQVSKIIFNFESEQNKYSKRWGIHTWGYDEFLPVNEEYLSHEILFASGANIIVHFKNRLISIEKVSKEALE